MPVHESLTQLCSDGLPPSHQPPRRLPRVNLSDSEDDGPDCIPDSADEDEDEDEEVGILAKVVRRSSDDELDEPKILSSKVPQAVGYTKVGSAAGPSRLGGGLVTPGGPTVASGMASRGVQASAGRGGKTVYQVETDPTDAMYFVVQW